MLTYLGAYLFDNVKPCMKIYQEEIFGPVLGVVRMKTLQEAMQLINDHEYGYGYGYGYGIFTRDGEAARHFIDHIQVGMTQRWPSACARKGRCSAFRAVAEFARSAP